MGAEESQSLVHEENRSKHDIEQKSKEESKTKIDSKVTSSETVTELNKGTFKKSDEIVTSHEKFENKEVSKIHSDEILKQNKEMTHTELFSAKHKESKEEKNIRQEKKEI